jgi:hypothetical protein
MISRKEMKCYVNTINAAFPVNALWDGYKIRKFKKRNLVIGGSQDWIYFHNIDVIFKKVTFFNLPAEWSDTSVNGKSLFRLSTAKEFRRHFPDFEVGDKHVFAFDMYFPFDNLPKEHTYFVLASNVFFDRPQPTGDGMVDYEDPAENAGFMCKENRV